MCLSQARYLISINCQTRHNTRLGERKSQAEKQHGDRWELRKPGESEEWWEGSWGGGVTVRHEIEKGLGLQSVSNRQPLQVLEDGTDKTQPSFRTRNPRVERSGLK